MAIAFGMFHVLRSLARERRKLSCGLRGNGMCFRHSLLREVPHDAFSVVEDLEYGLRLGRAGHRVFYAHEAAALGEMVASEKASRSQRRRWEGGRALLLRQQGLSLLSEALRKRSALLFDLAMDVWVPPLSLVAASCSLAIRTSSCALEAWAEAADSSVVRATAAPAHPTSTSAAAAGSS